jgi:hypothetical protein
MSIGFSRVLKGIIYILIQPVAVGVMLIVMMKCLAIAYLALSQWWHSVIFQLPSPLKFSEVIYHDSADGWISGCSYKLYRLTPETVAGLQEKKLGFLGEMPWIRDTYSQNPYDQWRVTPLKIDESRYAFLEIDGEFRNGLIHALKASQGCQQKWKLPANVSEFNLIESFKLPNNYYSFSQNREGLVFIDTKSGLALVIYWG